MNVGYKIKKLREKRKMSQPDLAEILGISQTSLSHIENGIVKKLDFLLMDKICKEFDVDFEYFLEGKQINRVKTNQGAIAFNIETVNNFPENIIEQLKLLIEDNKQKDLRVKELENLLKNTK
ncbi:helix-turn-helix transcriptional regulator [Flavobacterium sp.]|uniref:helix-turn-helix domain-containing protein n=1 Tax=Flavobacterium sp. TaxID=239 RepID=UPI00286E6C29|nr:helix-turn-helix transcriptional regulator [Flavobacterium sp.]